MNFIKVMKYFILDYSPQNAQKTQKAGNKGDTMNDVSILCNFIFVNILSFFFVKLGDLRG
ncbi:MAG: hypothetical protein HOB40_05910 [Candidatus Marinimicrobia bacterium]|jgi:hypothetical protein|nr:hypothetical protein [Candidatus Neomarinimicrobiota bacterium]MBT4283016.1 hypothetical protein [Candidatus Neomarinimicrobiota bacterium]MBT4579877.1 hypothetical protein [Candidatus Neomarinimicrobiota bacterium]MBT4956618.1 hypothetical protein [Candidatus Neomarinimicrobiota bacterium]MBT5364330.1 hypothetical protein [Candidatus Neomarinimicrobiota bacterium]